MMKVVGTAYLSHCILHLYIPYIVSFYNTCAKKTAVDMISTAVFLFLSRFAINCFASHNCFLYGNILYSQYIPCKWV